MKHNPKVMLPILFGVFSLTIDAIEIANDSTLLSPKEYLANHVLPSSPPSLDVIYTETQNNRTLSLYQNRQIISLKIPQSEMDQWNSATSPGFNDNTTRTNLTKVLYGFVKDDFDFIFFINNNAIIPTNFPYYGELIQVSSQISGISKWGIFDESSFYGSKSKLQSVINLPYLRAIQEGPTLHEIAHNWANFFKDFELVNPQGNTAALPHWGWTGIPGQLGGFDPKTLLDLGGGNWQANNGKNGSKSFGGFANGGNSIPYAEWELYLMGLAPVDSISDITYFTQISTDGTRYALGQFSGTKNTYTVQQFLTDLGPRNPSFQNSQKKFKCLFVILSANDLTSSEWQSAASQVDWLVFPGNDQSALYNFYEATRGTAQLDADLSQSLLNYNQSSSSSSSSSGVSSSSQLTPNQAPLTTWTMDLTQGYLNIHFDDHQPNTLTLLDLSGQVIAVKAPQIHSPWQIPSQRLRGEKILLLQNKNAHGQSQTVKLNVIQK